LKGQTWDFNSGDLIETPLTEQSAIQNPCDQDCPLEVIGIAPDNRWQLLQITDAPADYQGLWLVNEDAIINLVPYVPFYSRWDWSSDSHMLWLIYTLQDINGETYASESMVVDLAESALPQIIFQSWDPNPPQSPNILSPEEYKLVFSPTGKTVLSYEYFGSPTLIPANNQLEIYLTDVSQNPPQLLDSYKVHFPFIIDWSDTLEDFIILELGSTVVTVYALNHDVMYEIPVEVIKQMPQLFSTDGQAQTDFSSEDAMRLYWNLDRVVISNDRQYIVLMNEREAWVFSCSD
jgi:hypothetical protein